jgi:calcineurin-like phosphoesterase family protein
VTTYYSSDWHLGHLRIIPLCNRPFETVEEMNWTIINRCNKKVGVDDTLILFGDNVMGHYATNVELLREIKCKNVILIPGNHDRFSLAHGNKEERRKAEAEKLRDMGFTVIDDKKPSVWEHTVAGWHQVNISHYPYAGDSQEKDRHLDMRPVDDGYPLIHGHVHEKWRINGRMFNVGVDVNDFTPVSEIEILKWLVSL